ncbi:M23 family metallopeptidase [Streptomyces erythrochromogenes]|uniref:M23 family metallopeptidase n=1 Tax=Streptomyces erythrochromogenes TaxID=285574 RepID=UPI0034307B90
MNHQKIFSGASLTGPGGGRWRKRPVAVVAALVAGLLVAGCGAGGKTTAVAGEDSVDGALAGVTIPDSFSPVTVTPLSKSTTPWKGSDDKYHVSYDLQLTNASRLPATLHKVEVVDAKQQSTVVTSISGRQLVDHTCAYGDCNRLRMLPSANAKDTVILPGESRALLVDLTFDTLAQAPAAVAHHLFLDGQKNPPASKPTAIDYLAAPFDISAGKPRVISPPVKGDNWVAANGCCGTGEAHRPALNTLNGKLGNSQRFAIDWMKLDDDGKFYSGDKTKNESFANYGQAIYAVADGTISSTLDNVEGGTPGTLPAKDPVLGPKLTVQNVDGNHIIQDLGDGTWAMYAHLVKGSLLVKPGDKVKKGQKIADLGNTGNSSGPHLHFQLMDNPSLLQADAVPYVFDKFTYQGQVSEAAWQASDAYLSGTYFQGKLPKGQPRTDGLPLNLSIVDFPKS